MLITCIGWVVPRPPSQHPFVASYFVGYCWAMIHKFALVGSSKSLHSEACNALGVSDGVIHNVFFGAPEREHLRRTNGAPQPARVLAMVSISVAPGSDKTSSMVQAMGVIADEPVIGSSMAVSFFSRGDYVPEGIPSQGVSDTCTSKLPSLRRGCFPLSRRPFEGCRRRHVHIVFDRRCFANAHVRQFHCPCHTVMSAQQRSLVYFVREVLLPPLLESCLLLGLARCAPTAATALHRSQFAIRCCPAHIVSARWVRGRFFVPIARCRCMSVYPSLCRCPRGRIGPFGRIRPTSSYVGPFRAEVRPNFAEFGRTIIGFGGIWGYLHQPI